MNKKGITLIGMPGSGKSFIGKELSAMTHLPLLDIDRWMEDLEGGIPLAQLIEQKGADYVLDLETRNIRSQNFYETIVSTPGSIIYNDVLDVLQQQTHIIWLDVPLGTIKKRLATNSEHARLIIGLEEKGIETLFSERVVAYKQWAHYTINCDRKTASEIVSDIISIIGY